MEFHLFEKLCQKLKTERLDIQVCILMTCYNCIRLADSVHMPLVAITCNALETFSHIAGAGKVLEVQVAACECIMMLWYSRSVIIASTMNVKRLHLILER